MSLKLFKIGFATKLSVLIWAALVIILPEAYGRQGLKLFSIANNSAWNSASSWSRTSNGTSAGIVPQANDTIVISNTIILNVNFSFTDSGSLEISGTGFLRGDNLNLAFKDNSVLICNGQLRVDNISFTELAVMDINKNGKLQVQNSFFNSSLAHHTVTGKLSVTGSLNVLSSVSISGKGAIESMQFAGEGSLFGISPAFSIPDGSLVSEYNWLGSTGNDWSEPSNWAGGNLPAENSNIAVLVSANSPQISGQAFCNNLYINSGSQLTVNPSAIIEVKGNLSVIGAGKFLLKNTNCNKSSLILAGNSTGGIYVEYPVVAGQKTLLSSPVDQALSGTFINMYLRPYSESCSNWGQYIVPTSDPLPMMQGYELYSLFSDTRTFVGTPDNEPKTIAVSNSGDGLNLTGNPFPCFVDWENNSDNAWERSAIASAIYYPDPAGSGNMSVYIPGGDDAVSINNGSRYIAPMQGFFVKAKNQGSITVNGKSRIRGFNDVKLNLKNNSVKFKLTDSEGSSDETLFRVMENSEFGFDNELDAIKIKGNCGSSSIYLKSEDNVNYAVSSIPSVNSSLEIPLNIESNKSGQFAIGISGALNFEYRYPVQLEDSELNIIVDLRVDSVYTFYHTPSMNGSRFKIKFESTDGVEESPDILPEILILPGEIFLTGADKSKCAVRLFSIDGQLISSADGALYDGIKLSSGNQPTGICLLQISDGKHSVTRKILTR